MRGFLGLAVVAFVLGVGLRDAQGLPAWIEELGTQAARGDVASLKKLADPAVLQRAGKDADAWAHLCESIWGFEPHISRARPRESLPALVAMLAHAKTLRDSAGSSWAYARGWAFATMALCRHRARAGAKAPQPEWADAVEVLRAHANKTADVELIAALSFTEATVGKGADVQDLSTRSLAALNAALALIEEPEKKVLARAAWHTGVARALLARKKKGPAKQAVLAGVAALAPHLDADKPTPEVLRAHGELALLNHAAKLKVKGARFRWKTHRGRAGGVTIDLPDTSGWMLRPVSGQQVYGFAQLAPKGYALRSYALHAWPAGVLIKMRDGSSASTSDTKNLAATAALSPEDNFGFRDVESQSKLKKARLHKSFSDAYLIVVEGTRTSGYWARARVYYFKSKATKKTYSLVCYENEKTPWPDGMHDLVLSNLRVAKKRR